MKKRDILIVTLVLIACVASVLIVRSIIPETKSLENIEKEIDNLFLAETGTTYYGNWMFSKSEVRELEQFRMTLGLSPEEQQELARIGITLEISEDEWIDLWVGLIREGSNWLDVYDAGVFDCSEMAAFAECLFEQMGYGSVIAFSSKLGHAWVLVEKSDGNYAPVEATGMFLVTNETITTVGVTYTDYLHPEKVFNTIYEAEFHCPGDYDWWNSVEKLEQFLSDDAQMDRYLEEWVNTFIEKRLREAGLTPGLEYSTLLLEQTKYLEYGQYWIFSTELEEGHEIEVTVEVKQGGPIDVLLFNSGQYLQFEQFMEGRRETIKYFVTGSALNVMSKSYTFQIPTSDRYYVVINNGGGIKGGARPKGDVAVYLKVVAIVRP